MLLLLLLLLLLLSFSRSTGHWSITSYSLFCSTFLTKRHILNITTFRVKIYIDGRSLSSFKLSCSFVRPWIIVMVFYNRRPRLGAILSSALLLGLYISGIYYYYYYYYYYCTRLNSTFICMFFGL